MFLKPLKVEFWERGGWSAPYTTVGLSKNVDSVLHDEGYDSDGELGPFFDAVEDEDELACDEDEVGERENGLSAAGNSENAKNPGIANTENTENRFCTLTDDEIDTMLVRLLKGELKKLGLSIRGKKSDLIRRLKEGRDGKVKYKPAPAAGTTRGEGETEERERELLINLGFSATAK